MAMVAVIAGAGLFAYHTLPAIFSSEMEERFVVAKTPFPESPKMVAVAVADAPSPKPIQDRIDTAAISRDGQPASPPTVPAPGVRA